MAGTQTLQGQRYWHTVRVRLHVWENMEVNKFRAVVVRWRLNSSRWIIERQCVSSQWWLWSKIIGWRWCNESSCLWHLCARLMGSGLFLIAVIGPWQRETYFREQAQPTASEQKKKPPKKWLTTENTLINGFYKNDWWRPTIHSTVLHFQIIIDIKSLPFFVKMEHFFPPSHALYKIHTCNSFPLKSLCEYVGLEHNLSFYIYIYRSNSECFLAVLSCLFTEGMQHRKFY